jgi:SAM-dependent methyltransferase
MLGHTSRAPFMRRTYQTQWQDIPFSEFAETSSRELAGPEFYQAFYQRFFEKYQDWDQLSAAWRDEKKACAEFVAGRVGNGNASVLAVGCGLGAIEHFLKRSAPNIDLHIHEVAPSAWRWISREVDDSRRFVGLIPACLPEDRRFDFIYLSAIDYALDDSSLVNLLAGIRPFLAAGETSQMLLISASFDEATRSASALAAAGVRKAKAMAAEALDLCRLRPLGQFWGWSRTRAEYQGLMQQAGYKNIHDGFIDPQQGAHYWIAGR